ncbi:MAG TPA: serine/threonine-protein kinase, partial [Labilithrix sp.]|nr:serine/threonine-protein kinase [Labilithrix sp.]
AADPRIGTTVGGKYLVTEPIGRGGMGVVYRAIHRDLGEPVAVKFLHRTLTSDPELRARFHREALALARLRHPGIVALLDVSGEDEEPFMIMELVQGLSLEKVLEDCAGNMALPRIGDIFSPLLEVLAVAHARGIVHRDIKPSNVMLLEGDHVKLLDFGLVHLPGKDMVKLTETGMVHGTPDYMSPEQCEGYPSGPPTDIYAIGVMLFEAIAGQLPFEGPRAATVMAAHLFLEPPTMAERSTGRVVPAPLEALVKRTLSKTATDRPTALELRQELTSILKGTDPATLAEQASRERVRLGALSRNERAFTGSRLEAPTPSAAASHVAVCIRDRERASSIVLALAVSNVTARMEDGEAPAPGSDGEPTAIILAYGEWEQGQRFARIAAAHPNVPVLVIDVPSPDATMAVIRAGASDMTLVGTSDSELARLVARMARRGR